MTGAPETSVLFVCMGNICRSPTAEGMFRWLATERGLADRLAIDSAGTHGYHLGRPPDPRAREAAAARGIDISGLRARRVEAADFGRFHHVLAMDRPNLAALERLRAAAGRGPYPRLLMSYAAGTDVEEVPDPYYGGDDGFENVLDLVEAACRGLLDSIEAGPR